MNCIVSRRTMGDWVHVDQVMIANGLPLGKNCDSLYSEEQQEAITAAMEDHPDGIVSSETATTPQARRWLLSLLLRDMREGKHLPRQVPYAQDACECDSDRKYRTKQAATTGATSHRYRRNIRCTVCSPVQ